MDIEGVRAKRWAWGLACVPLGAALVWGWLTDGVARLMGQVVNGVSGAPIEGAEVRVEGTALTTHTDEVGQFWLPYYPGRFTLRASAEGYCAAESSLELAAAARVDLARAELVPIPPSVGLWAYRQTGAGELVREATLELERWDWRVRSPAVPVCAGHTLLLRGACGRAPSLYPATYGGLPERAEVAEPELDQACRDVWSLTLAPSGGAWVVEVCERVFFVRPGGACR